LHGGPFRNRDPPRHGDDSTDPPGRKKKRVGRTDLGRLVIEGTILYEPAYGGVYQLLVRGGQTEIIRHSGPADCDPRLDAAGSLNRPSAARGSRLPDG